MAIGYEVADDNRSFEVSGITGTVTRYAKGNLEYPCYIVQAPFERYKLQVLKSMFKGSKAYDEAESGLAIQLYFEESGQRVGLGKIYPRQVKPFLDLFKENKITGYYTDGKELTDDYLYVLGS